MSPLKVAQQEAVRSLWQSAAEPALWRLVGNTPLLPLEIPEPLTKRDARLLLKAEWLNPGGSVKDRPAREILRAGFASGALPAQRLLDGQLLKLDGEALATKDSIQLRQGKVIVHKDGAPLTLSAAQTVMMSDGTKVFGNGSMLKADGTRLTLKEGEIVPVTGVDSNKR